jgi:hypothetical protein
VLVARGGEVVIGGGGGVVVFGAGGCRHSVKERGEEGECGASVFVGGCGLVYRYWVSVSLEALRVFGLGK